VLVALVVALLGIAARVAHATPSPIDAVGPATSPIGSADPAGDDPDDEDRSDALLARGALLGDLDLADLVDPTATSDDLATAFADAGAPEAYEALLRHQRPSRIGRVDLSLLWRHVWDAPRTLLPYERDSAWLVLTWRR
jgi:hypothetical protein